MSSKYGGLFYIQDLSSGTGAARLERVSLTGKSGAGGYDEGWLQQMLASHPQAMPIAEIEPVLEGAVPVCLEFETKAGPADILLVSPRGDIVIVECKLWRNPQARREVVGQILDYAKELPHLSYGAFETAIQRATPANGMKKTDSLYARVGAEADGSDEASFIDSVSRNLKRGRFLLLIVGDGIREGVEQITEFLQGHAGMHFTLGLVEVAVFRSPTGGYLVQPRVLAKTQMVSRGVVSFDDNRISVRTDDSIAGRTAVAGAPPAPSARTMPATISEERLYETFGVIVQDGAVRLRQFVASLEAEVGAPPQFLPKTIKLQGLVGDQIMTLGMVDAAEGYVMVENVVTQATLIGCREAALKYYQRLANLVIDEKTRSTKLTPKTKTGVANLPASDLLASQAEWIEAAKAYLRDVGNTASA